MDFKNYTTLGRTGLSVSRLGIAASYGVPGPAIEMAFHEHGINFLYWGSRRQAGMRDAILNLKGSNPEDQKPIYHSVTTWRSLHRVLKESFTGRIKSLNAELRRGGPLVGRITPMA